MYALRFSLVVALVGVGAGIYAGLRKDAQWTRVAERSLLVVFVLISTAMASLFFELQNADHERVQDLFEVIEFPREETGHAVDGMLQRPFALRVPPGDYRLEVRIADVHGEARGVFERRFSIDSGNRLRVEPLSAAPPR